MDHEDIQLVEQAKKRPEAYEALYRKYAQRVFNYFWYRIGHQKDVAEDLLQETFIRAYQSLPKFSLRAYSYYSYLLTIAHNVLVNYYRKPKAISLESVGDVPTEIAQHIERKDAAGLLWRAVQQLSEVEKNVVLLRYQNELPIKDIARIVGKSENATKLVLSRVRKKLRHHPHLMDMIGFGEYKRRHARPKFLQKERKEETA